MNMYCKGEWHQPWVIYDHGAELPNIIKFYGRNQLTRCRNSVDIYVNGIFMRCQNLVISVSVEPLIFGRNTVSSGIQTEVVDFWIL